MNTKRIKAIMYRILWYTPILIIRESPSLHTLTPTKMIILRILAALALTWSVKVKNIWKCNKLVCNDVFFFNKTEAYCGRHSPRCFSLKSSDPDCSPSPSYFPPTGTFDHSKPSPCVTYVTLPLKSQPLSPLPPSCQDSSHSPSSNALLLPIYRQQPLRTSSSTIQRHSSQLSCASSLCPYCKTSPCSCEKSPCDICGKSPCCCEKSPCSCCGQYPCCCEKSLCDRCGKSPCSCGKSSCCWEEQPCCCC